MMAPFKTLADTAFAGKTVLLRADLNVPMQDGRVSDATRIERLVPTLQKLSADGAKIVLMSHFGRPKGRDASQSLAPLAPVIATACGIQVEFVDDCIGEKVAAAVGTLKAGHILLLENLRFYAEEEKNDAGFAAKLASLGDVYINDAFSCAHRAHASTEGIARMLPAYAGLLMQAELKALEAALENPQRPVMAIVGGAKISTKLDLLNNLVNKTDTLVLGGGMANTFLAAQGMPMGKSLCEREMKQQALEIMDKARAKGCRILLPDDGIMATTFAANAHHETGDSDSIPEGMMMLDIGPRAVAAIKDALNGTKTVLWNGPLGAFETTPFDKGTVDVARAVAEAVKSRHVTAVAGGGDTVAALAHAGVIDDMTYVSTAGGAFLEWLEGKTLPGVAALIKSAA